MDAAGAAVAVDGGIMQLTDPNILAQCHSCTGPHTVILTHLIGLTLGGELMGEKMGSASASRRFIILLGCMATSATDLFPPSIDVDGPPRRTVLIGLTLGEEDGSKTLGGSFIFDSRDDVFRRKRVVMVFVIVPPRPR